jgi:hypothetical protein
MTESEFNLSKTALRKLKRYGKIPCWMNPVPREERLTREELNLLGLNIQGSTQEHLWLRGQDASKLFEIKPLFNLIRKQ